MTRIFLLSVLVAAVGLPACGDAGGAGSCDNATATGYTTLEHGGVTREYILYVPDSYASDTPAPLVISFHGHGGCATDFTDDLSRTAEANGFIVAYPQGVIRGKGAAEWNPANSATENINENDVFFAAQLIADISADYSIDSQRGYAVGYSNGGMMSYGLVCALGDQIAAAGIMSGVMLTATCDTANKSSIIHFHGTDASVLPLDGRGGVAGVVRRQPNLPAPHRRQSNRRVAPLRLALVLRRRSARRLAARRRRRCRRHMARRSARRSAATDTGEHAARAPPAGRAHV